MALGAWTPIPVASGGRTIATVGGGVHYSCAQATISSIFRIDTTTDTEMSALSLSASITAARSIVFASGYLWVGTWQNGIWRVHPTSGATTQVATPAALGTSDPLVAVFLHGGNIHWVSYKFSSATSLHVMLDPATLGLTVASTGVVLAAMVAAVSGNRAIVLPGETPSSTAIVIDL